MKNTNNNLEKSTLSKKKKVIAGTTALGLGAAALFVGATTANWGDSENIFAEFSSNGFDIEISVDGETWTSGAADGTNDTSAVELAFAGTDFTVGEKQIDTFYVRVSEDNPSSAVLWLSDIEGSGNTEGFSYEFSDEEVFASGSNLTVIEEDGFIEIAPGEEVEITIEVEGTVDLEENASADVIWEITAQEENAFEAGAEV